MFRAAVNGLMLSCAFCIAQDNSRNFTYYNARYGYSVVVPASFSRGPESENGDGRLFSNPKIKVKVSAWGDNNVFDQTAKERFRELLDELKHGRRAILRQELKANEYSVTWRAGSEVNRQRSVRGASEWSNVLVQYPFAQKSTLEALAKSICSSLTPPKRG